MEVEMKAGIVIALVLGGVVPARADERPLVSIREDIFTQEGQMARFEVMVSGAVTADVEVVWRTDPLSATSADFGEKSGKITFSRWDQTFVAWIEVPVYEDIYSEGSEAFRLQITRVTNADV